MQVGLSLVPTTTEITRIKTRRMGGSMMCNGLPDVERLCGDSCDTPH